MTGNHIAVDQNDERKPKKSPQLWRDGFQVITGELIDMFVSIASFL